MSHRTPLSTKQVTLSVLIPVYNERDSLESSEDGKRLHMVLYPRGGERRMYLKLSNPAAGVRLRFPP